MTLAGQALACPARLVVLSRKGDCGRDQPCPVGHRRTTSAAPGLSPGGPRSCHKGGCCQTNANSSQFISHGNLFGCKNAAPLGDSGGTAGFEIVRAGEGALRIEQVVDRGKTTQPARQCVQSRSSEKPARVDPAQRRRSTTFLQLSPHPDRRGRGYVSATSVNLSVTTFAIDPIFRARLFPGSNLQNGRKHGLRQTASFGNAHNLIVIKHIRTPQ